MITVKIRLILLCVYFDAGVGLLMGLLLIFIEAIPIGIF